MTRRTSAAVLALACALAVTGCSRDAGSDRAPAQGSATNTASATPTGPAGPQPPAATGTPSAGISSLPAVAVGKTAELGAGVLVTVSRVRKTQIDASGPGEVSGPGAAVSVSVRNGGGAALDLTGFAVTASYGQDVPAPPAGTGEGELTGSLAAGATQRGSYVFAVPEEELGTVQIQVSSDAAADVAVFQN